VGLLEQVCQRLELTPTQFATAESRYEAVAKWLEGAEDQRISTASIYPQGSIGIGTTVKPIGKVEFDVDLVCHLEAATSDLSPSEVKRLVGDRLRENGHYRPILEQKCRCWRLRYANEFHLDITPSIRNPNCYRGGELVPDRNADSWKASNPRGYRDWFNEKAKLTASIRLDQLELRELKAAVERLPQPTTFRGLLRRSVQLCKRHRDIWAERTTSKVAPISIIITTLAAKSYERCVAEREYDTELDLLLSVVRGMPDLIERISENGNLIYAVWNETTEGENFAEKWNTDAKLPRAFYDWHSSAMAGLQDLGELVGMPNVQRSLSESFGSSVVYDVFSANTAEIIASRKSGKLRVASSVGVGSGTGGVVVPRNTHYGS